MALTTPDKVYDFTSNAAAGLPVPGAQVDAQFLRHRQAILDTQALAQAVIRDDGVLKAGTVGTDQLTSAALTQIGAAVNASVAAQLSTLSASVGQAQTYASSAANNAATAATAAAQATSAANVISTASGSTLANINAANANATSLLNQIAGAQTTLTNAANATEGSTEEAGLYANLAQGWAEYMPGPLPPELLSVLGITGDHWSARWWANQAGIEADRAENVVASIESVEQKYLGAFNAAPATTIIGAIYYDTGLQAMRVWTGAGWQTISGQYATSARITTNVLVNTSTWVFNGSTVTFPVKDMGGLNVPLTTPSGCMVSLDGVLQDPNSFTVNSAGSITFSVAPVAATSVWMIAGVNMGTEAANSAEASALAAENAQQAAEFARNTAINSATQANTSASLAFTYQASAATRASAAQISAGNAAGSATTAADSATAASNSATAAQTSATNAAASASTATTQAVSASTSAASASTSATSVIANATSASASQTAAATSATNAATSAGVAVAARNEAVAAAGGATALYGSAGALSAAVTSAQTSATSSANSATASANSAGQAAGSVSQANALYGSATALSNAVVQATNQANVAAGHAASASAVAQLDVSGVNAAALHRSPNAISSMFIYDTSKDSDGGAWTEKCQHTSWYNEPLMGRWLGAHASEQFARLSNATFGNELIVNSDFSNGTTGWTPTAGSSASAASGVATFNGGNGGYPSFVSNGLTTVIGRQYVVRARARQVSGNNAYFAAGNSPGFGGNTITVSGNTVLVYAPTVQEFTLGFVATATTTYAGVFGGNGISTIVVEIDSFSVREVTAINTASGDYFQLTTDGKFYRLWKNLIRRSELFSDAVWQPAGVTISAGVSDPFGGTNASTLTATGVNGGITQVYGALAGSPITNSIYIRRRTGTGVVRLYTPAAAATTLTLTSDWQRVSTTSTSTGTNYFIVNMATVGDAVDVAFAQAEIGSVVTAYEAKTTEVTTTETFRGNKADFPKLAAVVAESTSLTIYDLNEPNRPMWMRLLASSAAYAVYGNVSTVAALNGVIAAGSNGGYSPIDFAKDSIDIVRLGGQGQDRKYTQIALRHAPDGALYSSTTKTQSIVNNNVIAVAMTVLPDAPLDPVSNMRVPTIVVATTGGVSVIKHNGTVVNSASTSNYSSVTISPYGIAAQRASTTFQYNFSNPNNLPGGFTLVVSPNAAPDFQQNNAGSNYKALSNGKLNFVTQPTQNRAGFNRLIANAVDFSRGLGNVIANTHNTGWLPGDIRRAYLADVATGTITGTEFVDVNNFISGTGFPDATISISGSSVTLTTGSAYSDGGIQGTAIVPVTGLTPGRVYALRATIPSAIGVTLYNLNSGRTSNQIGGDVSWNAAAGTYVWFITASAASFFIGFKKQAANVTFTISGISLTDYVADRSYKALSITPFGTLTKTQLATNTSLVGYSGWSASNYLREAYSTDLEFGTGEWSCSAWANVPATLPAISFTNVGSELVSNGTFAVDAAGWTSSATWSATVSVASGVATVTSGPTGIGRFIAPLSCVVGRTYRFKARFAKGTGGGARVYIPTASNGSGETAPPLINGSTTLTELSGYFTATASTMYIALMVDGGGNGATALFDDISVFEVAPAAIAERAHSSGPRIALGVVATGQLVATAFDGATTRTVITASAYNTATWLKAEACYTVDGSLAIRVNGREVAVTRGNPLLSLNSRYNLLLNSENLGGSGWNGVGTPSGSVSGSTLTFTGAGNDWFYQGVTGVANRRFIASVTLSSGTKTGTIVLRDAAGTATTTITLTATPTRYSLVGTAPAGGTSTIGLDNRTSAGGDGIAGTIICSGFQFELADTPQTTPRPYQRVGSVATDFDFQAPLTIGNSFATDAPFPGSIALLKLGATVPTADQSLFMYEQEKQMFRAGAQTVLPDANSIIDMAYDDATDRWVAISSSNESYWTGLVRNSVTAVPSGSYSKVAATSGVELIARATTTPGVDINMPPLGLREEFARRAEAAAKASRDEFVYDFVGGFTATTVNGNTAITIVANLSYPTSYIGARVSGSGIPTNTTIVAVSGTTIYLSAAATASASNVSISFLDFALPVGMTAKTVISAGAVRQEGATKDFTRLWDGFYETIRFGVAPGVTAWVQIQATRDAAQ